MTPAQLDVLINGAFVCERHDGTVYATWASPPAWARAKVVRRTGRLTADDLAKPASEVLAALNAALNERQQQPRKGETHRSGLGFHVQHGELNK